MRLAAAIALAVLFAGLLGAAAPARADTPPESDDLPAERWSADPRLWRALIEYRQRLRLELTSSRDLCTAGTLTEISWQIAGGKPPYSLQVEGSPIAADADNIRINCGQLTEAEAADEEAELAPKRITATVTDSRGARREAAIDVARARALPAPVTTMSAWPGTADAMSFSWVDARGAEPCDGLVPFAARWRQTGTSDWNYALARSNFNGNCDVRKAVGDLKEGVAYEAALAALRAPIELDTPSALRWTEAAEATTITTPSGVTASATHDTVTVRWNRQPSARRYRIVLYRADGGAVGNLSDYDSAAWGNAATGEHEFVFRHLPADTQYKVTVIIPTPVEHPRLLYAQTEVRTATAPPSVQALPRGPQNLRATATADSIAVRWDAPFVGASSRYQITVYHPRYPQKPLIDWVYQTEFNQSGLEAGVTYQVHVEHTGIVRASAQIAVTTTAPATETPVETTTLRYNAYDATGEATAAGTYAFLSDSGDTTSAVATYDGLRDGTTKRLIINKTDAQRTSRATLYDAAAAGDFFEWRETDDCWVRYRVTEVLPDPPGAAPRKLLAVEWTTYAFTGCSGAIAANTAVTFDWGPLPNLGGVSLTAPVVHGPYQLVPEGWSGAVQEPRTYDSPGYSATNPIYTRDLAEARRLPYWRDPALPAGWTFSWVTVGDVSGPTYGYWAVFATERGGQGVTIEGYYADYRRHPEDASWRNGRGAFETRTIAGRPARVAYSPPGPSHDDLFPVTVWIYDPSTETEYVVLGKVKRMRGSNVDAVIAIARSLFEE